MISFSRLLIFFILIGSVLALILYRFTPGKPTITLVNNTAIPDSYANNVDALQMSSDGLPDSRLQTPLMIHYQEGNAADISLPIVTIYQINQPNWQITALKGRAVNGSKIIYVWDDVKAYQAGDASHLETTLTTTQATVYPDDKIIFTNQPVMLTRPGLQVQSVGVRANIKTNEIILFSQAKAYYNQNIHDPASNNKQPASK